MGRTRGHVSGGPRGQVGPILFKLKWAHTSIVFIEYLYNINDICWPALASNYVRNLDKKGVLI